jgi:hypothetical protein
MPEHVTGCFSIVTASVTLPNAADAAKHAFCDGSHTRECENVWRTARKYVFDRLQK